MEAVLLVKVILSKLLLFLVSIRSHVGPWHGGGLPLGESVLFVDRRRLVIGDGMEDFAVAGLSQILVQ